MQQGGGVHEYAGMGEVNPQFVGGRGSAPAHAHGHMLGISQDVPHHSHPEQLLRYSHPSQPHRDEPKTDSLTEIPSPISSRPPPPRGTSSFEVAVGSGALGSHEDQEAVAGEDVGDRGGSSAANRWPRQETLALLKIRSDMDSAFRDATLKGPLWDDVARKLEELGYHRSAKKCKEKFENVHKYYKRTKDGRAGRQDGKSYRFFSQLEALHGNNNNSSNANNANTTGIGSTDNAIVIRSGGAGMSSTGGGMPRLQPHPPAMLINTNTKTGGLLNRNTSSSSTNPLLIKHYADSSVGLSFSTESSEGEEYGDTEVDNRNRKRKRCSSTQKMIVFFENLMRQVMEKQEIMQQKFLQTIEKREHDRMIREEAWKRQEMARLNREHEIMAQERALSASRDAAFISFLQKITGQTFPQVDVPLAAAQNSNPHQDLVHESQAELSAAFDPNSTRWPKAEVLALIKLRSGMDSKYQDAGPKGPLWDEISAGMSSLGFNRSAKRCKEKWENINKYFKKVKESNKKRREDAKTCPYFQQLDQLYKRRIHGANSNSNTNANKLQSDHHILQEEIIDQQLLPGSNINNQDDISTDQGQGHGHGDDILALMPPPPPSSDNNNSSCQAASTIIPSKNGALPTFYSNPENNSGTDAGDQRALTKVKMKPQNVIIDANSNMRTATSCASLPDLMSFDPGVKAFTVSTNSKSVLKPECFNVMEMTMDMTDHNIQSTQHRQSIVTDDYDRDDDQMEQAEDDSDNNLDDGDNNPTDQETHQRRHFYHLPFAQFVQDRTTDSSTGPSNSFAATVQRTSAFDHPGFKSSKASEILHD